jgi:DNA polymerase type B, organellar and viral
MHKSENKSRPAATDGRYSHYLQPVSAGQSITRLLAFACDGQRSPATCNDRMCTETLVGWTAIEQIKHNGTWRHVKNSNGVTVRGFWEVVEAICCSPGILWIVCYGAERCWPLIGLWEELAAGRIRIAGSHRRIKLDGRRDGRDIRPGFLVTDGPPSIAQIRMGNLPGSAVMVDLRNYGIEYDGPKWHRANAAGEIGNVFAALESSIHTTFSVSLSYTAAGTANRIWRHDSNQHGVHCHADPLVLQLERDAHVGGRCECYRLGKLPGNWYVYDIRSCYGGVMRDELLPVELLGSTRAPDSDDLANWIPHSAAIARVMIETDTADYPVALDDRVIYPTGRFFTTLCGHELRHAWVCGRVRGVTAIAWYRMAPALREFAIMVNLYRKKYYTVHGGTIAQAAKSLLVSITGRVGQRMRCWQTNPLGVAPKLWGEWTLRADDGTLTTRRSIAGVVQDLVTGDYAPDAVPSIAVWIQSYARDRLRRVMSVIGREHIAYCDTDCVIVDEAGHRFMQSNDSPVGPDMGDWSLRDGPAQLDVMGLKHYRIGDTTKCAGSPKGLHVQSADGSRSWWLPPLTRRVGHEQTPDDPRWIAETSAPAEYRHGIVYTDGFVSPITLEESP